MNNNYIKNKIAILGGGSAGWLAALYLRKIYPTIDISVIEDSNRPPIIAGESGTTTFTSFLKSLKIDSVDFIKQTNATPKLGGRFKNWNGVGSEFIHAMQTPLTPDLCQVSNLPNINFGQLGSMISNLQEERITDLYISTIIANDIPLSKAFYSYQFIEQNKVPFGAISEEPCTPMWHFESRAAAAYFKNIGILRNIKLIDGQYQSSTQKENGDISSLTLTDGRKIEADWFFDCSGFSRLLLGGVLEEPLIDYTNYFPARSVVAWWDKPAPCVTTNANAMNYGWSWNINLRHRSGNGYIYDPDHISLDQAINEAEKHYGYKIEPIANFSFTPGVMKNAWKNNVIAVGLSNGFLEPLEANGVQVIIDTLWAVEDLWRPDLLDDLEMRQNIFNHRVTHNTDDVRDFLSLHYRGKRRDTDFWKSHAYDKFRIPDTLREKLSGWEGYFNGHRNTMVPCNGYSTLAWLMVIQALEVFDISLLKDSRKRLLEAGENALNNNYKIYREYSKPFWTVEQWLDTYK